MDPATKKRQDREAGTLGDLVHTFLEGIKDHIRPTTLREWIYLLKHDRLAGLRAMKPHEVQRADVIRLVDKIAQAAPYSANRTFECLRRCYSWAMQKALVGASPCVGVRAPAPEKPRSRLYGDDELRGVILALAEAGKSGEAVRLCLHTGTRIRQALGARWTEFDLDKREWLIPGERAGTKNALDWLVPLTQPVLEQLARLRKQAGQSEFVFPARKRRGTGEGPSWRQQRGTYRIREVSGVADFTPHDLRRSLNSWLAAQRVSREVRDAVLGHRAPRLERTYNVYDYASEKRRALERWARHLERLTLKNEAKVLPMVPAG